MGHVQDRNDLCGNKVRLHVYMGTCVQHDKCMSCINVCVEVHVSMSEYVDMSVITALTLPHTCIHVTSFPLSPHAERRLSSDPGCCEI